jgi:hypothetical protein
MTFQRDYDISASLFNNGYANNRCSITLNFSSGIIPMKTLNRSIAILKPRQPYVDWINATAPDASPTTIEAASDDCSAILIPEFFTHEGALAYIRTIYDELFDMELADWITDEELWPGNRSFEMFLAWFEIELHSMVFDAGDDEIEDDEFSL